ncbi:MAG TPA: hypothetical protein VI248_18655 [Kineosporiaceae bacterium]
MNTPFAARLTHRPGDRTCPPRTPTTGPDRTAGRRGERIAGSTTATTVKR